LSNADLQKLYECKINIKKHSVDDQLYVEWVRMIMFHDI
jgi:hypothetical protein